MIQPLQSPNIGLIEHPGDDFRLMKYPLKGEQSTNFASFDQIQHCLLKLQVSLPHCVPANMRTK